jgi:tyrosinase
MRRLSLLLLALLALAALAASTEPAHTSAELRIRKDVKDLTAQEKADFVAAVIALKHTPSPWNHKLSYYDQFVHWHNKSFRCAIDAAHMHSSFLPWHREFLLLFENAVRKVSGKPITIPYWDWTDPNSTAAVFAPDFMGGMGDASKHFAVVNGPFRKGKWRLNVVDPKANDWYGRRYLVRRFATKLGKTLPTANDVNVALGRSTYDVKPFDAMSNSRKSFRNYLEGWRQVKAMKCEHGLMNPVSKPGASHDMHNRVHLWVGGVWGFKLKHGPNQGTMALNTSLNDPVFWLHHANIDRIWAQWEAMHRYQYRPLHGQRRGENLHDRMWPNRNVGIKTTIAGLLRIKALGYTYANP